MIYSVVVCSKVIQIEYIRTLKTNKKATQFKKWANDLITEAKVKVAQSCPTSCNPLDNTVHRILQSEYWSGYSFSSPGDLPNPGIELRSPTLQADSLPAELPGKPSSPKNTHK